MINMLCSQAYHYILSISVIDVLCDDEWRTIKVNKQRVGSAFV